MHICALFIFWGRKKIIFPPRTLESQCYGITFQNRTREIVEIHKVSNIVGVHDSAVRADIIEEGSTENDEKSVANTDKLTPIIFPSFTLFFDYSTK